MTAPRTELGDLWRAINREMHDRFRHIFKDFELPHMALILLRQLVHEPGLTIGELARRSGTVKSHVSKMIEQLVQQGYVEKRPDPDDQRLVRVYATQAAADKKAEMEARVSEAWSTVVDEIPEVQREAVVNGFRILLTALEHTHGTGSGE